MTSHCSRGAGARGEVMIETAVVGVCAGFREARWVGRGM